MVTFRLQYGSLTETEIKNVLKHIISGDPKFYSLIAAQVMPDHVHLILNPNEGYNIQRIVKGIKGGSARKINLSRNMSGKIWMKDYFDRIIRTQRDLEEKLKYIYENPMRKGLVADCSEYKGWYLQK